MTQNLRLVGPLTLNSTYSDMTSGSFSLPASTSGVWPNGSDAASINSSRLYNSGNTSYGVYYNWYTATAGSGTYSMSSGTATSSVCPKSWKIPTYQETTALFSAYNDTYSTFNAAVSLALAGYYKPDSGSVQNSGNVADWTGSNVWQNTTAYGLVARASDGYVDPHATHPRAEGRSIRCVAR